MAFWDPFEEMRRLQEEMYSLFRGERLMLPSGEGKEVVRAPVTGLRETDREVIATFELPGVDKSDLDVNVTDESIEVSAKQKVESEEKAEKSYRYYSSSRVFYRKLPLPAQVKPEDAKATYNDGILKVVMPKAVSKEKSRKLEVK